MIPLLSGYALAPPRSEHDVHQSGAAMYAPVPSSCRGRGSRCRGVPVAAVQNYILVLNGNIWHCGLNTRANRTPAPARLMLRYSDNPLHTAGRAMTTKLGDDTTARRYGLLHVHVYAFHGCGLTRLCAPKATGWAVSFQGYGLGGFFLVGFTLIGYWLGSSFGPFLH